jgi:hypothetical protein
LSSATSIVHVEDVVLVAEEQAVALFMAEHWKQRAVQARHPVSAAH